MILNPHFLFLSYPFLSFSIPSFVSFFPFFSSLLLLFSPLPLVFFPFPHSPSPLISYISISSALLFSFPFWFPFISPHLLAQPTHLADLTNEDTTYLSLILLYPLAPSLHLPPQHHSIHLLTKRQRCASLPQLCQEQQHSTAVHSIQHSFRPELCEHQLFFKWVE